MNLVCPHCQNLLTVPDESAGQMTTCSSCNQKFLVPSLPQSGALPPLHLDLPTDIALAPEPPAPEPPPRVESTRQHDQEEPVYKVASEPSRPRPLFATYEGQQVKSTAAKGPQPVSSGVKPTPPPAAINPPPPPSGDYTHTRSLTLRPRALPPIITVLVIVLFLLFFFPWTGVFPGGYGVYTQSGLYTMFGSRSTDEVGVEALGDRAIDSNTIGANWLMIFYFLLMLAALVLTLAPFVVTQGTLKLPPALQRIWPWRLGLLGAALVLAFLILLLQTTIGFGIERAVDAHVDASLVQEGEAAKTPERQKILEIKRAMQIGQYAVHRTSWYRLAMLLHLAVLVAVGLELWLENRGSRPLPRADFHW